MDELSSSQISEWEAYDKLEPIGRQRDDYRTALLCSTITNLARALWGKKGAKMTTMEDFLLNWGIDNQIIEAPKKQSMETMKDILYSLAGKKRKGK